jgi:hypothetical protein
MVVRSNRIMCTGLLEEPGFASTEKSKPGRYCQTYLCYQYRSRLLNGGNYLFLVGGNTQEEKCPFDRLRVFD